MVHSMPPIQKTNINQHLEIINNQNQHALKEDVHCQRQKVTLQQSQELVQQ